MREYEFLTLVPHNWCPLNTFWVEHHYLREFPEKKYFKKLHTTLQYSWHGFLWAFSQAHHIFPFSPLLVCWNADTTEGEGNYSCSLDEKMKFSNLEIEMQLKWTWLLRSLLFFFLAGGALLSKRTGLISLQFSPVSMALNRFNKSTYYLLKSFTVLHSTSSHGMYF